MDEIQLQFKVNGTIRSAIMKVPNTYGEVESEIRKHVSRLKLVDFGIMYENHDGELVVLNKDPRCLRIAISSSAIIPGTDLKRLKVVIFEGSSPSARKEKTQEYGEVIECKSPLKKRPCPGVGRGVGTKRCSDVKRSDSTVQHSTGRKKLTFSNKAKIDNFVIASDDSDDQDENFENMPGLAFGEATTPFQRYVKKTEEQIRLKEDNLRELQDKVAGFQEQIEFLKSQHGNEGKMCHNCHLRLGHTSRNCPFDSCTSLFECGQEKLHPGQNVGKQYIQSINKLKNEIDQLRRDLDNKLKASQKVKTSISHNIEKQLLEENNDNYYEGGIKNWTLLRRHVYALQSYCKKHLNGKIPPRYQLIQTLDVALEECELESTLSVNQARPRKHRDFTSKDLLERHGVEFPNKPHITELQCSDETECFLSNTPVAHDYSRLLPKNEIEEFEQLNICIRESMRPADSGFSHRNPANIASNSLIYMHGEATCSAITSAATTFSSTRTTASSTLTKPKNSGISTSTISSSSSTQMKPKSDPLPEWETSELASKQVSSDTESDLGSDTESAAHLLLSLGNIK